MEKKYAIILFKGKEYLCGHEDGCHYDVSCPVRTFTEGEDDFKIHESGKNRSERTFRYHGKGIQACHRLLPERMAGSESGITGQRGTIHGTYRQSEDSRHSGFPTKAFIDTNNNPEAMEFLIREQPCRRYGI